MATVKNEGPSLVEWVAHHRNIGFTDIVIYQNDSFDGSDKILRTLDRHGFIKYFHNPDQNCAWQNKAYRRVSRLDEYLNADWCMALDGDEYLSVNVGDGRVSDLVDHLPEGVTTAYLNWKIFGSSNRTETSSALVTEDFTWGEDASRIDLKLIGYKSLFKPSVYKRPGIHSPKVVLDGQTEVICNGSGQMHGDFDIKGWRSADTQRRALAQVNHYVIRDAQRFIIKSDRGRTSNSERDVALEYWQEYNLHAEIDVSLLSCAAGTRRAMKFMDDATKGRLGFLTHHALRLQRERFEALLADPYYSDLYRLICNENDAVLQFA